MKNLYIVLVRPKYSRNVGLVSRIMSNYGLDRLILIDPQCCLDEEARQGAAQGQEPLSKVTVHKDWYCFYKNELEGPRIALTRRQGKRRSSSSLKELLKLDWINLCRPTYLIFGPEDHGLSTQDLKGVHRLAFFDLPGPLQSMNLSHSVLLAMELFYQKLGQNNSKTHLQPETIKDPEPFLKLWLESLQFDLSSRPRWNALTMLKQMIMKATPTARELHHLEMIIQQTIRRMNEQTIHRKT